MVSGYGPEHQCVSEGVSLGISRQLICAVVDTFYARIAEDEQLGPIFHKRLAGHWQPHLEKMYDFWTTVMFGYQLYSGNPVAAHGAIAEIEAGHYERWLNLFREVLDQVCPHSQQADAFYRRAQRMAAVLGRGA